MPNQKHLNILKQGVEVWNQWRKENTAIPINLSGYNFQGMALVKYDLSCVDLRGADLKGIVFFEADFKRSSVQRGSSELGRL